MKLLAFSGAFILLFCFAISPHTLAELAEDEKEFKKAFVSLQVADPSIIVEARYYSNYNFVGQRIRGYNAPKCIITRQAAEALASVQTELKAFSLSLKVYDCYRPQRAVDDFVEWAKDLSDTRMKKDFYPTVAKRDLFRKGYIAKKSSHSRGSTVDLTIVPLPLPEQPNYEDRKGLVECHLDYEKGFKDKSLDMGTAYDCFHPLSYTLNPEIGRIQKINRLLLKLIMEKYGFTNLPEEWWHYTLRGEPFPNRFFDFEIN